MATETVVGIVNPAAGGGRSIALWCRVERALAVRGVNVHTLVTKRAGDGTLLTARAREAGHTMFAAVGGDGTVHEVVNGLLDGDGIDPRARLAVVPAGTGMDFARNIEIRHGVRAAVERIVAPRERRVDIGIVPAERRAFVNFMETGLGAAVVARESHLSDAWPGRVSFLIAALGAAMAEQNMPIHVCVDGQSVFRGHVVSVVVANGRYFGGGMKIAPIASMDDGYLDLLVLGDFRRRELIREVWKIYPGIHLTHAKVVHLRARSVSIEAPSSALLDLDGELGGNASTTVQLLPAALRVLV